MEITLLYFHGCPNWVVAEERLAQIAAERPDVNVTKHRVESVEEAERIGFHGSPSIRVNGVDAFARLGAGVGLACRVYATPQGLAGAPTLEQLRELISDADQVGTAGTPAGNAQNPVTGGDPRKGSVR
ncbi:MAG: thioredoxin family protein [Tomitella sp.]|uniref:thioredoxin family protein n=1 Tax=Intrasporangium sp. TaxID=1925024 RepID=UPI002647B20C|nr:thioredoxin family protein [Intrasporangium sp.]MDN5760013.1 thioredoxin family protein [Tomitella sp.]MDN5797563.1 thioredoxin family protein [Intrasporangium sp.]